MDDVEIPVARDFGAIHLSVLRYPGLTGEVLEVDDGFATLLAGWNPDETCWVNDLARLTVRTESWHQ